MFADIRRKEICDIIKAQSAITTSALSKKFGVSIETIRKDLLALEKAGELVRVHGGAVLTPTADKYLSFSARLESQKTQKSEIAHTAASFIENGDIIAVDSGSTAVEFIGVLMKKFDTLTIVTYSLDVFQKACSYKNFNMILCGGFFLKGENSFYGDFAEKMLEQIRVGKVFVFPSSISLKNGICEHMPQFVQMQRKLISSGDKVYVVADSSKFGKSSLVKMCDINPKFTYITDTEIADEIKDIYKTNNIQLITSEDI